MPAGRAASASGLVRTWETPEGAWAVVAMGHLGTASDTFWQVLFRPHGSTRWTLVTPPGVASNGGLSAAPSPGPTGPLVVGFEPSALLAYSPVARTTDEGRAWSAGVLPSGLLDVADALAAGEGGGVLALVRSSGGTLLRSEGSLTRWAPVVTEHRLAASAAGRACGVMGLSAVAESGGVPELGADCSVRGVVGLFSDESGTWTATGPRIPSEAGRTMDVLRLTGGPGGTESLVEARSRAGAWLVAMWREGTSSPWSFSAPVRIDGRVLAAGSGEGQAMDVVTGRGWRATGLLSVTGPGARWRSLGAPPDGTEVVVDGSGGSGAAGGASGSGTVALAVSGSTLSVLRSDPATGRWQRTSRVHVPIEYGSST